MLIEFSVTNFRSFRDRQTLSLVAGKGNEHRGTHVIASKAPSTPDLLRSVAVYGPNAAGKTSLLAALDVMAYIVAGRYERVGRTSLPYDPFVLSPESKSAPTEFEAVFVSEGVRYQYGFSLIAERIVDEWLYAWPNGKSMLLFHRHFDPYLLKYDWSLGSSLRGRKKVWEESTRDEALFLSTAVQLNSSQLEPVVNWFRYMLRSIFWHDTFPAITLSLLTNKPKLSTDAVVRFMREADFSIGDFRIEQSPEVSEKINRQLELAFPGEKVPLDTNILGTTVFFDHCASGGERVELALDEESGGTQRLFAFAGPWLDTLESGYVLLVDEIHARLHPLLVEYLIGLFNSPRTNPRNAQLVFSTHETSILNQETLRRDQVWFCENSTTTGSRLYPLTDFSPRKGAEDLERSYLLGRYGAIPYLGAAELSSASHGN